jgi:cytochrome c-type biogenesis protein
MGDWFGETAGSGSLALAVPVAVIAGLVSFFSPCVIPLLPAYLSYATGLSGADLATGDVKRGRMVAGSVLFVAGFTVVFVLLGVSSGAVATWLLVNQSTLNVVVGVIAILMGLAFVGLVPLLQRDVRFHRVPAVGLGAAPLLGFLFGVGWTPCVGPTLTVILGLGYQEGTVGRSGLLLAFYSLGLGVPFILAGLFWKRALGALGFVRRHQQWVTRIGGLMLVGIGVLLVSGAWEYVVQWLQIHLVSDFEVGV